jgi:hypothetical protein
VKANTYSVKGRRHGDRYALGPFIFYGTRVSSHGAARSALPSWVKNEGELTSDLGLETGVPQSPGVIDGSRD